MFHKKGNSWKMANLTFFQKTNSITITIEKEKSDWLVATLHKILIKNSKTLTFQEIKASFETNFEDFELFWYSKTFSKFVENALLIL